MQGYMLQRVGAACLLAAAACGARGVGVGARWVSSNDLWRLAQRLTRLYLADPLFPVANAFHIGAYQVAINEGADLNGLSENDAVERDAYVYRSYIALGSHQVRLQLVLLCACCARAGATRGVPACTLTLSLRSWFCRRSTTRRPPPCKPCAS